MDIIHVNQDGITTTKDIKITYNPDKKQFELKILQPDISANHFFNTLNIKDRPKMQVINNLLQVMNRNLPRQNSKGSKIEQGYHFKNLNKLYIQFISDKYVIIGNGEIPEKKNCLN